MLRLRALGWGERRIAVEMGCRPVLGHLEAAGIPALVVNAFHARNVPGRKTDVGDSEWLAQL